MSKLFQPTQKQIRISNLYAYENYLYKNYKKNFKNYSQLWNWSVKYPCDFWKSIAEFYQVPLIKNEKSKLMQKILNFGKIIFFLIFRQIIFNTLKK